jgi:hypothetical protein
MEKHATKMGSNLRYVAGQKEIPFFQQQQQQAASKFSGWFPSFNTKTSGKHGKTQTLNHYTKHHT